MKHSRHHSATMRALLLIVASLCLVTSAAAQSGGVPGFRDRHQVGIRLGAWSNLGDTPPAQFSNEDIGDSVFTSISSASFYFEAYFAYRIHPLALVEISGGITNRGEVNSKVGSGVIQDIGSLVLYPILLQVRFYAPFTIGRNWFPYAMAGFGVYHGRNSIQISNEIFFADLRESSATAANYVLGAGVDWAVASSIALDFNAKYMPARFGGRLLEVEDWQALTISVGVKYLWAPKKQTEK